MILSITGFGRDGPDGTHAGYDQNAQGEAGLMSFFSADSDVTMCLAPAGSEHDPPH